MSGTKWKKQSSAKLIFVKVVLYWVHNSNSKGDAARREYEVGTLTPDYLHPLAHLDGDPTTSIVSLKPLPLLPSTPSSALSLGPLKKSKP